MCEPIYIKFEVKSDNNNDNDVTSINERIEAMLEKLSLKRVEAGVFESISGNNKKEKARDNQVSIALSLIGNLANKEIERNIRIRYGRV